MNGRGVAVELDRVSFTYRSSSGEAGGGLSELSLTVPAGRVTAVLGPSGAGKSTLLSLVAGLLAPDRGEILLGGRPVTHLPPEKRNLGVVFQSYALFDHMTVEENVAFALTVRRPVWHRWGHRWAWRRGTGGPGPDAERVAELLERFEITPLARRHPRQLSGGERQRVALARALAAEPRALLLDEPLAALDARLRLALRAELAARLAQSGVTALYVTHDQEEAMALGDRVALLRDGRLEQVGTPEELYRRPASPFVASFIGEANFLPVAWDRERSELSGPLGTWSLGTAEAEALNGAPEGRLMVRPEDLAPAAESAAHLAGTVVSSTFLGGRRRLRVRAPLARDPGRAGGGGGEVELAVDLPGSAAVAPGERLPLAIDFRRAVLLPEEEPPDEAATPQPFQTTRPGRTR